jgi:hypothetical protein
MKIETKYNIDDEVWYKGFKGISYDKISNIRIEVDCFGEIHIYYELWNDVIKEECKLFPTKEELLNEQRI